MSVRSIGYITLALHEVSCYLHALVALTPEERTPYHWIGSWVAPRAGVDVVAKRNILPCRE